MPEDIRHSRARDVELITDPDELAAREALNGLQQFDGVMEMVEYYKHPDRPFRLRLSHILHIHRLALEGISSYAGNFRPSAIEIGGSKHQPVGAHQVPEEVEALCDYVNEQWGKATAVHLAAYVLWKLNWIHPFTDGNGRTSRALSYLVLCVRLGYALPGTKTIPDQISEEKHPYYAALKAADRAWKDGQVNLSEMEKLLSAMLAKQLLGVLSAATGREPEPES
ncbi:MAG TPA: Fic family protein [Bryobacteraceae bacterium]|nr:Fic family protein [Bryobacteraceae bacterium]